MNLEFVMIEVSSSRFDDYPFQIKLFQSFLNFSSYEWDH